MNYASSIVLVLAVSVSAAASAAAAPAYVALHVGTTPGQIVLMRFPSMPACRRELPGLKAFLAEEMARSSVRRPDLVSPDAVPGHITAPLHITGVCRAFAKAVTQ